MKTAAVLFAFVAAACSGELAVDEAREIIEEHLRAIAPLTAGPRGF